MNRCSIAVEIPEEVVSAEEGYLRVVAILAGAFPGRKFFHRAARRTLIPIEDQKSVIASAEKAIAQSKSEFPTIASSLGFEMRPSTAFNEKSHNEPGMVKLEFLPHHGIVSLEIYKPEQAAGMDVVETALNSLLTLVRLEPAIFGNANVIDTHPTDFLKSYSPDFNVFPHRKFLGWMGFVPAAVMPEQVPAAARVVPVDGKGTVIVAVDKPFDIYNPEHIKQANAVEMQLADLDLLPVTDSTLL